MRRFQMTKRLLGVCILGVGLGLVTQAACSTDAVSPIGEPQSDAPRPMCRAWPRPASNSRIKLVPHFTNLSLPRPIGLFQAPGDDTRWYEADQTDSIQSFANAPNVTTSTELLAAPLAVELGVTEEGGLLGFAFHPDYVANGTAFLAYTVRTVGNPGLTQRLERDGGHGVLRGRHV